MSRGEPGWYDEEGQRAWLRLSAAAAFMLAAHVAAVAAYLTLHRPVADLAATPIVTVEFAPPSVVPPSPPADVVPTPDPTPPEPVEEVKPPQAPIAEAAPTPPAEVTPPPAEVKPEPEPAAQAAAPPVEAKPHPKAEPEQRKKPPAKPVVAAPPQTTRVAALPTRPDVARAGADEGRATWRGELIARLARAQRYPAAAAAQHQTGTVQLSFTVSRNGRVLSRHIARSSGSPVLDQEALAMVERAQPLPPFPPSMPEAQISLDAPVRFSLR